MLNEGSGGRRKTTSYIQADKILGIACSAFQSSLREGEQLIIEDP